MEQSSNSLENLGMISESPTPVDQSSIQSLFKCSQCEKNFSSKHCLIEHYTRHSKTKPYLCLICDKHIRHASQFSLHKKAHKGPQVSFYPCLGKLDQIELFRQRKDYLEQEKVQIPFILGENLCFLPRFLNYFSII